jgi:hypothetical protein
MDMSFGMWNVKSLYSIEHIKLIIRNQCIPEFRIDNGFRIVNVAKSNNFTVKSTMPPHRNMINTINRLQIGNPTIRLGTF